jgi:hypothetical protein
VPNLSKLGLFGANKGWLREKFGDIGLTQFESSTTPRSNRHVRVEKWHARGRPRREAAD